MRISAGFAAIAMVVLCFSPGHALGASSIWINELHYDNDGPDADEFLEVVVGPGDVNLDSVTVTFYNGHTGACYDSRALSEFTPGAIEGGYSFCYIYPGLIQNGSPDGIAVDVGGTVIEFISYEGAFAAVDGPAAGMRSMDIGVSESPSTPAGSSLGLWGTGCQAGHFAWTVFEELATPGQLNVYQEIGYPSAVERTSWGSIKALYR